MDYAELIRKMKHDGIGLMRYDQYVRIAYYLNKLSPCNFLVFGLGEDSPIWKKINQGGRTVFLEDDKEWIKKFDEKNLEKHEVIYDTKAKDHESIGFDAEKLQMSLPKQITETSWDIILVDGPLGHNPPRPYKGPGRMKSIYQAHKLLRNGGICVVDDMLREIEQKYAYHYFGMESRLEIIDSKVAIFKKP